jgi:hypothetical protein
MSAATTAPVIAPASLKFSPDSMTAIAAGTKIATVRLGVRRFPEGAIKAVDARGHSIFLQNVVTTTKKMSELTESDAKANGSDSLDELKDDLANDYPGIQPNDVVTVISFRPAAGDSSK